MLVRANPLKCDFGINLNDLATIRSEVFLIRESMGEKPTEESDEMSINCWFVFQIKAPSKTAQTELLNDCPTEIHSSKLDRVIILHQEHRYEEFKMLDSDEQSEVVERCLGDPIIAHLADPRGVCVIPEVGQDFTGKKYDQLVSEKGNHWVKCVADPQNALDRELPKGREDAPGPNSRLLASLIPRGSVIERSEVHQGSRETRRKARELGTDYFGDLFSATFKVAHFEAVDAKLAFVLYKKKLPLEEAFSEMKSSLKQEGWVTISEKKNEFLGTFHLVAEKPESNRILIYFDEDNAARIIGLFR